MVITGPDGPPPRPRPAAPAGTSSAVLPALSLTLAWGGLAALAWLALAAAAPPSTPALWMTTPPAAGAIAAAWLVGARAALVLLASCRRRHPSVGSRARATRPDLDSVVALLYPTADDFRADVVRRSMRQSHRRVRTVILDDSRTGAARAAVDAFAAGCAPGSVEIVRRADRRGFKAGNLNNYLRNHADGVDAVVILDADQEIGPDFVGTALRHLRAYRGVAVVQVEIRSRRGGTRFVRDFRGMFDAHLRAMSAGRSALGIATFAGRGALLDVGALRAAGGFPEVVAEDAALTLELAARGYTVRYVPDLVSVEDAPTDYTAFTTQLGKFTEGAMQLLGRKGGLLFDSRLRPARRLDVFVDLASPLVGAAMTVSLFPLALALAAAAGGGAGRAPGLPLPLGASLGILGAVPLLPEALRRMRGRDRRQGRWQGRSQGRLRGRSHRLSTVTSVAASVVGSTLAAISFLVRGAALYASVAVVALRAVLRVAAGNGARFVVTPKENADPGLRSSLRRRRPELAAASAALVAAVLLTGTVAPAGIFCAVAVTAVGYSWLGGRPVRRRPARRRPARRRPRP
ncbi:glycosyltransferase family 2 protein [Promicromonospora sp. NPDC050262]|uniref:glycosyltransferase family 2 protein n=1 Tax=Promicromonospora sp. NPDC050262 TaxID=3155036 RepID=UPI0033FB78DA